DGIGDWSVTGVQTCALPIYEQEATNKGPVKTSPRDRANGPGAWHRKEKLPMHTHRTAALSWLRLHCRELAVGAALALTVAVGFRSEERRVGKEGRSRVWRGR